MAVSFDAGSSAGMNNVASVSWTHTPVGTPTAVFVTVSWLAYPTSPNAVSAITYGGVSMLANSIGESHSDNGAGASYRIQTQTFYLLAPSAGTQTVAVTFTGGNTAYGAAGATTVTGAISGTPTTGLATNNNPGGRTSTPTVSVPSSTSGNLVLGTCMTDYQGTNAPTAGSGKTLSWANVANNYGGGAEYVAGGGAKTMDWTAGGSCFWNALAFEIVAATPPVNSVAPAITGTAQVGQTLTCSTGTWSNSPTGYSYQWKSAGSNVGTDQNTYVPVAGDVGNTITCVVTASNAAGAGTPTSSAATSAVIAIKPANTVAPAVTPSSGTVGTTFSCTTGTWDNTPTSYAYQWKLDGSNIGGATSSTYASAAAGALTCVVTATNTGESVAATSNSATVSAPTSAAKSGASVGVGIGL